MWTSHDSWFSTLGAPLGESEEAQVRGYLAGLGFPSSMPIALVASWEEAAEIIHGATGEWWAREEAERARLEKTIHLDPADPEWIALNDRLHGAAAIAAARACVADQGLIKAAAGSASYAAYQSQLASAAGTGDDHPFMQKYALFAGGRWPLGIYDDCYRIY